MPPQLLHQTKNSCFNHVPISSQPSHHFHTISSSSASILYRLPVTYCNLGLPMGHSRSATLPIGFRFIGSARFIRSLLSVPELVLMVTTRWFLTLSPSRALVECSIGSGSVRKRSRVAEAI